MQGSTAQGELATCLGAQRTEVGDIVVDAHQQTTVPGLYAIGDVVNALNQISVALGHAAIAATAVHNRLPENFRG
jgi:thioredoxin reductase (NADPH)